MSPIAVLLLSLPVLFGGAAIAVALRSNRASAAVVLVSQSLACGLVVVAIAPLLRGGAPLSILWDWPRPIESIAFRVDALSAFFLAWSLPMTLLGTVYAVGYLQSYFHKGRHGGPHFALLNLIAASFVLIYSVQNALVFLLGWEIAAVAAWLLVIWDYRNQKIRFAGFNYLVSTHVGLFVLVAAFMLLHATTDSMDFEMFGAFLARPSMQRSTAFVLLGVSFALKSAFFPFHTWLPRAHSAAPAHVSALMSGVIHKAGLFAFLRFTMLLRNPDEWMGWTVLGFGALSALLGVLHTVPARDLKRLLGYSSTENVGIAAMGFGLGYLGWTWNVPPLVLCGFGGGLFHILNHALFKCLLFYAAGSVYRATHTIDLERLGGLAKRLPHTAALFLVGSLAIAALPPLNGFWSELMLYTGLLAGDAPTMEADLGLLVSAAVLAFVGAVGALSMTRAFGLSFLGRARDAGVHVSEEAPFAMLLPMRLHALFCIVLGIVPELGVRLCKPVLTLLPVGRGLADFALPPVVANASRVFALVLLCTAVVAYRRARETRRSVTWACGYTAGSARMQYTGSSFAQPFARIFRAVLPVLRRERIQTELFPQRSGQIATHTLDAVEARMFEVLGEGEAMVSRASQRIPEQPRFAFAAGLIALVIIGLLILGGCV